MNDNDVMDITEIDEYYVSNDFDVEIEIVAGMEIGSGDEIEISATKHISLSSAAYISQSLLENMKEKKI